MRILLYTKNGLELTYVSADDVNKIELINEETNKKIIEIEVNKT